MELIKSKLKNTIISFSKFGRGEIEKEEEERERLN